MSREFEILFMQTRLIRLAAEEWKMPIGKVAALFRDMDVFGYIEAGDGIFHCEGDYAVLDDVSDFLSRKGISVHAEAI